MSYYYYYCYYYYYYYYYYYDEYYYYYYYDYYYYYYYYYYPLHSLGSSITWVLENKAHLFRQKKVLYFSISIRLFSGGPLGPGGPWRESSRET